MFCWGVGGGAGGPPPADTLVVDGVDHEGPVSAEHVRSAESKPAGEFIVGDGHFILR
jgi:hypothetical protein